MGRVLMTELLQIVGRQTGHFHHRRRINIPFEHGLRDAKKGGALALFYALLHTFLKLLFCQSHQYSNLLFIYTSGVARGGQQGADQHKQRTKDLV